MAQGPAKDIKAKRKMPFSVKFAFFIVLVTGVIFFPTSVVFCVCMLPTFVAYIIDRFPEKTMWITVGALNIAATMPALFSLWSTGPRQLDVAISIISDSATLMIAYGGAAAGWIIFQNITPLVAAGMVRKNDNRLKEIEKRQKELVRKWGEDVSKVG